MDNVKIICPSRRRSKSILTDIDNMILCVDEKELTRLQRQYRFTRNNHSPFPK